MPIRTIFWNVENYTDDSSGRADRVVAHVTANSPDVIGFSEIKDKDALRTILMERLVDYDFGITDGDQGIELMAGWKRGVFEQALFTQRREFKAGSNHLRPGSLLAVRQGGDFFNILFLHTDSGTSDRDYRNRQDMFEKIWGLKNRLDQIDGGVARLLVLGDLNTMGRRARGGMPGISAAEEILNLSNDATSAGMRLESKDHPHTWADVDASGRIERRSNLDHVISSASLTLQDLGGGNAVNVRGWVDAEDDAGRHDFVENISDHCSVECVMS